MSGRAWVLAAVFVALLLSRLCHSDILWADADYHLAGAVQVLAGRVPYRDFWFDKPPLVLGFYALAGAPSGAPLMVLCAGYLFAACLLARVVARQLWSDVEGVAAGVLLGFFLIFYHHAAVIPVAVDAAMMVPHLAAVALLLGGWPLLAGVAAGVALFVNVKAVFVLAALLAMRPALRTVVGFGAAVAVGVVLLASLGALSGYWEQVWVWGFSYAGSSPEDAPMLAGLSRSVNWLGFHVAAVVAVGVCLGKERQREMLLWLGLSVVSVCVGMRFQPRYFLQVLPVMAILAARGICTLRGQGNRVGLGVVGLLLLVPVVRFGPRYVMLAQDLIAGRAHSWSDVVLDQDSHHVAEVLQREAKDGDTVLVWGYRPAIYVYARMTSGSRFMDSQPLTGVPAERHFRVSEPVAAGLAAVNRAELVKSRPTFIVDALGFANRKLAITEFGDLGAWLAGYRVTGRTELSVIFTRVPDTSSR